MKNLFQRVFVSARTGLIFYSSITRKCFLLMLDRSGNTDYFSPPLSLFWWPFLIQFQATTSHTYDWATAGARYHAPLKHSTP